MASYRSRSAASSRTPKPDSLRAEAQGLLGRWTRLAQGHFAAGGGCSCGHGPAAIRLEDFEQDILDYLYARHLPLAELLEQRAGYRRGAGGSIRRLLEALAGDAPSASRPLIADLARSLASFEQLHAS